METFVALLSGINVGGHRKVAMADLRDLAARLGLTDPRTYIASGNLIFSSDASAPALEDMLEHAIEERFGFRVDVIVRTARQWAAYRAGNPFPSESEREPNLVMIAVGRVPVTNADVLTLRGRASANERIERAGDALWIYFGDGPARSKLGSGQAKTVSTTRNWRTVVKLAEISSA